MNAFMREAITEKLIMLNEEKESLDSAITDYQEKLKNMIKRQTEHEVTIKETVAFLKDNKNVKAERPKEGQERSGALKRAVKRAS